MPIIQVGFHTEETVMATRLACVIYAALAISPIFADGPPSKWSRTLPDGTTVELLGVCDPVTREWWTPDGKPIAEPICDVRDEGQTDNRRRQRAFAVRVLGPDINPTVEFLHDPYSGGLGGSARKGGKEVPGVEMQSLDFPKGMSKTDVALKVAATPWVTKAGYRYGYAQEKPSDGRNVAFTLPRVTEKGTAIVVIHDFLGQDARVVASRKDGKQIGSNGSHSTQAAFCVHDIEFFAAKPEDLERIELQVRPIETVEFKDVPLDAPKP
jgi:hypothetical protein